MPVRPLNNSFATVACLLGLAWLGCVVPCRAQATTALRLNGSFIQYWDEMQGWPPETWHTVLARMKEVQMDTVIIQMLARENSDGTTHSYIGPANQLDATETILHYADTNDFKVFLGLYLPNWNHDMTGSNFLYEAQGRMATVAQQAWDRYLSGNRHRSFAGWYLPYESWTGSYSSAEITRLRSFFQATTAACRLIAGEQPVAISPFISSQRPPPCQVEQTYRQLLDQSGIDLLLLQDSVGAQQWNDDIVQRASPYFQAFRNACDATGVELWANLESFQISGSVFTSCDAVRLQRQFDATAPFVDGFVTFDFFHYMNPDVFLASWDQARRDRMRQLFSDYQARFVKVDYAPLSPPRLAASYATNGLMLNWHGLPGDQFEVQSSFTLTDDWAALDVTVVTNGSEFRCAAPLDAQAHGSFYRIRRLPRLQLPDSMLWIPPGDFTMGTGPTDTSRTASELTQFQAGFTRGFWIGRHEVTQSEYQNLMCSNPAAYPANLENPVEKVSWPEAMEYCTRLTQREHEAGRLPEGHAYRLPTEAEWEYAARAGSTNRFSFGDASSLLGSYGWYNTNSGARPHPVGELQPNGWGLQDVHGNVLEWCWDWIERAPTEAVTDFIGKTTGPYHAVRGGAWSFPWVSCRCGWRAGYAPVARQAYLGFRVVLAPPPS